MLIVAFLLIASCLARAQDPPAIFQRAVARQGGPLRANIKNVFLEFDGHARLDKTTQALKRFYWYTSTERFFRQRTQSKAKAKAGSERGFDEKGYWDLDDGKRVKLHLGNRDHRDLIKTIRDDRDDFERILNLVLLTRLRGARMQLLGPGPVKLRKDLPWSAKSILGKDRNVARYHVLEVAPQDAARLVLYVRTDDFTVRKAVQFDLKNSKKAEYYYYFYYGAKDKLPQYFSAHTSKPVDAKTRKSSTLARGKIEIRINEP